MQKVSEYNKSILAGYKLKKRKEKPIIGKINGKEPRSPRGAQKSMGQGSEQIKIGLNSDLFNKLEDYCKNTGMNRQEVIRLALRYHLNANI